MKKLSLQDGIIEHGQITSLAAAFSLQGKGFRVFLAIKSEGVDLIATPSLIAYGDQTAKPTPLVAGQWSESFIREIPIAAIDLTDYDLFYGLTEATEYTATLDLDGGTMALPHSIPFNYNTVVAKPAADPTREGYTFDEWQSGGATHNFATALTDNVIITAHWLENLVVTFNSAGGSAVTAQDVLEGETATEPTDPTKAGYTFDGWYNVETLYDFDDAVTENITLTAHWLENFTVSFNSDGGSAVTSQEIVDGSLATLPTPAPTKEANTFLHWSLTAEGTEFAFTTPITADTTLYAIWDPE